MRRLLPLFVSILVTFFLGNPVYAKEKPATKTKPHQSPVQDDAKRFVIKNENFQLSSYAKQFIGATIRGADCKHTLELIASENVEEPQIKLAITKDGFLIITMTLNPKDINIISPSKGTEVAKKDELFWCNGAIHRWKGIFSYGGYMFKSSQDDPLEFKVTNDGYTYVKGKGTVITPAEEVVNLPLTKSKTSSDVEKTEIKLTKNPDFDPVKFPRKFKMEVLKGNVKEISGAVFREGSSLYISEDDIIYDPGMMIIIGKGGIELKGKFYPEGTKLKVSEKGKLIEVKEEKERRKEK